MSQVRRHEVGEARYSAGVDRGVLYPPLGPGVPWSGLVSVAEKTIDSETLVTYLDGFKMKTQISLGVYAATISALSYPLEFEEFDGYVENNWTGQFRKTFGFAYRTLTGNDVAGTDFAYQIHLVYNAVAEPSDQDHQALGQTIDPMPFEWGISTTPIAVPGARPTSHVVIDSLKTYPAVMIALEDILYGNTINEPRLPSIQEVYDLFELYAIFKVTDHGDGSATISGPDTAVFPTGATSARFTWPSVVQEDTETYRLSSL